MNLKQASGWNLKRAIFDLKTKFLKSRIYDSYSKANNDLLSENIEQLNFERRKEMVAYAVENSLFYAEKYKNKEGKPVISEESDFLKLPPVTRKDLAENFEKFIVNNAQSRNYRKVTSSGSTGRPVSVLHDKHFPYTTLQWRILDWWGIRPYENQAFIFRYRRPLLKRLGNTLLWWPTKRIFLSGAEMDLNKVRRFVDKINKIKPSLLQGYVDVVYEFALFLLDNNLKIHPPKMVWVTSAPLLERQRKTMEKAFGAPVCDQYGNTEVFTIAAECPEQKGLHIMHDSVHVEVVDHQNKPVPMGETGKILITDLRNRIFPIIRYEIGDRGRLMAQKCSCGIPLPLMDNVRGRQSSTLKTPSGLAVREEHLAILFEKNMQEIREIQLIQKSDYSVEFCYVSSNRKVNEEIEIILDGLKSKTRNEISIHPKQVEEVQRNGQKKPLIVSQLN